MPQVVALGDIPSDRIRNRTPKGDGSDAGGTHSYFFRSPDDNIPDAFLVQYTPGGTSKAHYHPVDQFQLLVGGEGTFGRHPISTYSLHYSRAYTAYGPLASPGGWGFLTLRPRGNARSQRDFEKLKGIPNRRPWQINTEVAFPAQGAQPVLQAMPEIRDDQGLFAGALSVPANGSMMAPAPAGSVQYVVATRGSLIHDGREHKALAVVRVLPDDPAFHIQAGAQGLEGLVLNFSRTAHLAESGVGSGRSGSTAGNALGRRA
jgi:hypothetical protein